jgi:ribosomal protein S18
LPKGGYTKDSVVSATVELFRNCKFIDSKKQLDTTICKEVMKLLGVDYEDKDRVREFVDEHAKLINRTITDKRNYVQSRTKEAAFAWMADHNGTLPSVQQLKDCALRKINLEDPVDKEVFKWYWTVLLVDAHTTNEWGNVMMISYPSQARTDEDKLIITSASEALAVLMLDNNRDKWLAMYKYLHTDKKGDKIPKRTKDNKEDDDLKALFNAKYTVQDGGQKPFGGWIKQGKQEFVKLKNDIKKAKKEKYFVEVEKKFLEMLRKENPKLSEDAERPKKRAKIAKPEDVIETFDDDFE